MKKKISDLTDKQRMETLDMLYTAASAIRGRDAMKHFLKELLTPSERIMLGRRIWIARLLLTGKTHAEISEKLAVGPNTIVKVERWLEAQMPGYRTAISGLEKEIKRRAQIADAKKNPFGFAALKKKYPLHFLLFTAFDEFTKK